MTEECAREIKAFTSAGVSGCKRLKQVLPSLFAFYDLQTRGEQAQVLVDVGLEPIENTTPVSFVCREDPDAA
jgi:hypothetical protein